MRNLSRQRVCGRWLAVLTTGALAFHVILSNATAQQRQVLSSSPVHAPATMLPTHDRSVPAPGKLSTNQGLAGQGGPPPLRRRPVEREVAGRVAVAGGVLVLPTVAYYGVPVILNVPDVGYVELSEERYAQLYDKLLSNDTEQVQQAVAALKDIKAAEDAEVEALQHRRVNQLPPDGDAPASDLPRAVEWDLSEPVSFERLPLKFQVRRRPDASRGLY
jgi:hypothetical protein